MSERILFVDRDGTILEEPHDFQVDSFERCVLSRAFCPHSKRFAKQAGNS